MSAVLTYFQQLLYSWRQGYEPFYSKTNEEWIDSRPSLEYNEKGDIVSMRKCPPLYLEYECPANFLQEDWESYVVCSAILGVIFIVHIIMICLLTED